MINIIDGTYFLHRAYHVAEKHKPGRELHGYYNLMLTFKDEPTAVVFDTDSDNFRHELFSEYKAGREPKSKNFLSYRKKAQKLTKYMGFAIYSIEGYEGDDILGTLAAECTKRKLKAIIHTADKDIAQFVSKYVTLYNPRFKRKTTLKTLKNKDKMTPKQVPSYLALLGDDIDNIPGVFGIGPTTALKLITEYKNVKGVIKNRKSIKGKVGKEICACVDQLKLSYKLTKGITVPDISVEDALKPKTVNSDKIKKLLSVKRKI